MLCYNVRRKFVCGSKYSTTTKKISTTTNREANFNCGPSILHRSPKSCDADVPPQALPVLNVAATSHAIRCWKTCCGDEIIDGTERKNYANQTAEPSWFPRRHRLLHIWLFLSSLFLLLPFCFTVDIFRLPFSNYYFFLHDAAVGVRQKK